MVKKNELRDWLSDLPRGLGVYGNSFAAKIPAPILEHLKLDGKAIVEVAETFRQRLRKFISREEEDRHRQVMRYSFNLSENSKSLGKNLTERQNALAAAGGLKPRSCRYVMKAAIPQLEKYLLGARPGITSKSNEAAASQELADFLQAVQNLAREHKSIAGKVTISIGLIGVLVVATDNYISHAAPQVSAINSAAPTTIAPLETKHSPAPPAPVTTTLATAQPSVPLQSGSTEHDRSDSPTSTMFYEAVTRADVTAAAFGDPFHKLFPGPTLQPNQRAQISCMVDTSSSTTDRYWYRIASEPWNNRYYVPISVFVSDAPPNRVLYC